MSHTPRSVLTAVAAAALLATASPSRAALKTPACLAKKLAAWGNRRKCEASENGKALQGKPAHLATCQTTFNATLTKLHAGSAVGLVIESSNL